MTQAVPQFESISIYKPKYNFWIGSMPGLLITILIYFFSHAYNIWIIVSFGNMYIV